jgi:hypothetical protein
MSDVRPTDLQRVFQLRSQQIPPAEWVRDMIDHYRRTGTYRPEDLRRLLGDPNRAVEVGPNASLSSHLLAVAGEQE